MSVELPRRMGPFLLLRHLASGGMGEVYLAHQSLGVVERLCVVKTVRAEYAESGAVMRRFLDEARTTALLSHKNVAAVLDVGEALPAPDATGSGGSNTAYIAVEHVAGRDLHAVFQRSRRLKQPVPEDVALYVIGELLDALAYVHRATDPRTGAPLNIVHRDISPQNVMVSFQGEVKLIDFGVARSAMKSDVTQTGQAVGKIRYMAPEQARAEKVVDSATDVFAACIVAVELLTGRRFYGDMSMEALWMRIAGGEPHEPQGFAKLSVDLQNVLKAGLDPDRTRRPTASELKDRLQALQLRRGTLGSSDGLREHLALLFEGAQEEERRAHAQLLSEPTSFNAARLPSATVMEETPADALLEHVAPDAPTDSQLDTVALAAMGRARKARSLPNAAAAENDDALDDDADEPGAAAAAAARADRAERAERVSRSNPKMRVMRGADDGLERTPRTGALHPPSTNTQMKRRKKRNNKRAAIALGMGMPLGLGLAIAISVVAFGDPDRVVPVPLSQVELRPIEVDPPPMPRVVAEEPPRQVVFTEVPVSAGPPVVSVADPVVAETKRKSRVVEAKKKVAKERPKLLGDRVRALRACAPKPQCAAPVLSRAGEMASLSAEEVKALDEDVDWCLSQCR